MSDSASCQRRLSIAKAAVLSWFRRRRRIIVTVAALLAFSVFFLWCPCDRNLLLRVIPDDVSIVSWHNNLASEMNAFVRNPMMVDFLKAAGVDEAVDLADDVGTYQALFWLTGPETTLALQLPDALRDSPGDLSSLSDLHTAISSKQNSLDGLSSDPPPLNGLRLYGISHLGWKRRLMEVLWGFRYVPGLGHIDTTESGTRYIVFRRSRTMRRLGLVLSLDMRHGHLLAVLSQDPDAVTSLVARADALASTPPPSFPEGPHHIFRIKGLPAPSPILASGSADTPPPDRTSDWTLSIDTFRDKERLALHLALGDKPAAGDWQPTPPCKPPANAGSPLVLASASFPIDILPGADPQDPPTGLTGSALLYGSPCSSTFCGFRVPGLVAFLPPELPDPRRRVLASLAADPSMGRKHPALKDVDLGVTVLDLRPVFSDIPFFKPDLEESPFLLVPPESTPSTPPVFGSCLASYRRLAEMPDAVAPFLAEGAERLNARDALPPEKRWIATGWIHLRSTIEVLDDVINIVPLAAGVLPLNRKSLDQFLRWLHAVGELGTLHFAYREPFLLDVVFSREP